MYNIIKLIQRFIHKVKTQSSLSLDQFTLQIRIHIHMYIYLWRQLLSIVQLWLWFNWARFTHSPLEVLTRLNEHFNTEIHMYICTYVQYVFICICMSNGNVCICMIDTFVRYISIQMLKWYKCMYLYTCKLT